MTDLWIFFLNFGTIAVNLTLIGLNVREHRRLRAIRNDLSKVLALWHRAPIQAWNEGVGDQNV